MNEKTSINLIVDYEFYGGFNGNISPRYNRSTIISCNPKTITDDKIINYLKAVKNIDNVTIIKITKL